jgi:hypothetical protein
MKNKRFIKLNVENIYDHRYREEIFDVDSIIHIAPSNPDGSVIQTKSGGIYHVQENFNMFKQILL